MTDTWLTDRLSTLADTPGPIAPPVTEVIATGRRTRRRRQRALAAGVSLTVLAVAATGVTLAGATHHGPATLRPAGAPDEGLRDSYWLVRDTDTGYQMKDGTPFATTYPVVDTWWGNNRDNIVASGPAENLTGIHAEGAFRVGKLTPGESWQALWDAPTDPAGLTAFINTNYGGGGQDLFLQNTITQMLIQPAPLALREALVSLLDAQPRAMTSMGRDTTGRPALVTTIPPANPDGQTTVVYTDPDTSMILERAFLAGKPGEQSGLPQGHLDFYDVYSDIGPTNTVPALSPPTPSAAPASPSANGCTPGTPEDATKPVDVQMAKICLPDPAPGFPFRVQKDTNPGDGIGNAYSVSTAAKGGDHVLLQVDGNDQYFLSLASTPAPVKGKVGADLYVGSETVLGVTASEVTDTSGNHGLVLEKDGLGIEAFGSPTTSYAGLGTLVGALQGIAPA